MFNQETLFNGDFVRHVKGSSGKEQLSPQGSRWETTERGYFTGYLKRKAIFYQILFVEDSERYVIEGSGKGPRLETWKGGSFYRELWETNDGRLWKQNISLYGTSARGTWREGSFTGDPERYVTESSGNAYLSLQTPHWGTWWEGSFTGEFERPEKRSVTRGF